MSENYYISMEVHGFIAYMVDAKSIREAKQKALDGDFSGMDFMDVSLTEVKVSKPTYRPTTPTEGR